MCSHTPQECPLGTPMGTSIEMYTHQTIWRGLQTGLRYLQIAEIWLFWTYPWNPRYHGNRPIWPFWTSEIPPVSSYSRLHIHIWTYSGTLWHHPQPPVDTLWGMGHHMCSHTPQECPLGISMYLLIQSTPYDTIWRGLQIGLRSVQTPEIWLFWTYHQIHDLDPFWHAKTPPVSSYSHLYIQIWTPFGTPQEVLSQHPPICGTICTTLYPCMPFGIHHMCIHTIHHMRYHLRWSPEPSQYLKYDREQLLQVDIQTL